MFSAIIPLTFIIGAFIGSFLNVVIYRYGTGMSVMSGRSMCPSCGKKLGPHELVPIFSFLFQRGRCSACGSKISWQYPTVEFLTGVLFAFVAARQYMLYPVYAVFLHGLAYSAFFLVYYWIIVSILMIIAVYDLRHFIIPDGLVFALGILSVLKLVLYFCVIHIIPVVMPYVLDALSPVLLSIPFWFLWKISHGQWIGLGDAKLSFGIGALLGFVSGLNAIALGFWIGAVVCIVSMLLTRFFPFTFRTFFRSGSSLHFESQIPLAPFLVLGTLILLFFPIDPLHLGMLLG